MKPIRELISRGVIDDLWGAGYTILPRRRYADPFFVPEDIIPRGRSYQWMHLVHDHKWISNGWVPVPASRHDGHFLPAGYIGDIEVNGLGLFEKAKIEVNEERQTTIQKARDQADPAKFFADKGFSGSVTVGTTQTKLGELDTVKTTAIGATKTIEDVTKIPRELTPYIAQIFEERDRLSNDFIYKSDDRSEVLGIERDFMQAMSKNPSAPRWPTLHAIILPIAIENIRRKKTKEEAEHGQAS